MPKNEPRMHTIALLFLISGATGAAEQIVDDFSNGLVSDQWAVVSNQVLFSLDDSNGRLTLSKGTGGSGVLDRMAVAFTRPIVGDFDLSVSFREASIDRIAGSPGNQIQLEIRLGEQLFVVVRSDEVPVGPNAHVFIDPPTEWRGEIATAASSGVLRITRAGATVSGLFDDTLLFQGDYGLDPLPGCRFALQNNGTTDAVSVVFDDFLLLASEIGLFADDFESGNTGLWSGTAP